MIIVESKRCRIENLRRKYPTALIADVTSQAGDELVRLSPFYPHGSIPVPFSDGMTADSVESIWQGLKVFESADVDTSLFHNDTMRNLKRTVRRFGKVLGHRKGVGGTEILDYHAAKMLIYIPTYKWVLENKAREQVEWLKTESRRRDIVLLDYNTCQDVDACKPMSHAFLIKAYIEGIYPYGEKKACVRNEELEQGLLFDEQ